MRIPIAYTQDEIEQVLRDKSSGRVVLTGPGERLLATVISMTLEIQALEARITEMEQRFKLQKGGY